MNESVLQRPCLRAESQAIDLMISRTEGSYVFHETGRRSIDFVMGWTVGNLGCGHDEIRAAMVAESVPHVQTCKGSSHACTKS